jgi:HNH endonuclease
MRRSPHLFCRVTPGPAPAHRLELGGCWVFTGSARCGSKLQYGQARHPETGRAVPAHRLAWELENGPIPEGLDLDHLCRRELCIRPFHLEPVTHRTNVLRGQAPNILIHLSGVCAEGHSDWYQRPGSTSLQCRPCRAEYMREWRRAHR